MPVSSTHGLIRRFSKRAMKGPVRQSVPDSFDRVVARLFDGPRCADCNKSLIDAWVEIHNVKLCRECFDGHK